MPNPLFPPMMAAGAPPRPDLGIPVAPSPSVMTMPDGTVVPTDVLVPPGTAPDQTLPPGMSPLTSPRPQPRPGQAGTVGAESGKGMSGFARRPLTDAQKRAIASFLKQATEAARKGKSPIAALLVPLIGGLIQGMAARREQQGQAQAADAWKDPTRAVFGALADDPRVEKLMSVINDKNAPSFVRSEARDRLDEIMGALGAPDPGVSPGGSGRSGGSSGGSRRSSGRSYSGGGSRSYSSGSGSSGSKSSSGTSSDGSSEERDKIYGEYNIGGYLYGRNRYGEMVPYLAPDGSRIPMTGSSQEFTSADPATGLLPGAESSEPDTDPLGIRDIPDA